MKGTRVRRLPTGFWSSLKRFLLEQKRIIAGDRMGVVGIIIISIFLLVAVFGETIAPYGPFAVFEGVDGFIPEYRGPSMKHPFGLTQYGEDVFSQVLVGTRIAVVVGIISAFMVVFVGANIGLLAGYYGGWVDEFFMRVTDIAYGIPFLPMAIVLMSLLGRGVSNIIIVIVLLFWRSTSRVIRSQVLTIKERPFINSARVAGAGNFRIIYHHIAPNVMPMTFLYVAFAIGWAVLAEASISFLGFGDPDSISWGQILHQVFANNAFREDWWWYVPPGVCIMLFVMSAFWIGRAYEKVVNPRLR
jgi:peptide/nickel transport system permease protein